MSYVCPPYGEPYWYRGPEYGYTFTFPVYAQPSKVAWECPRCKAMNAPHVDRCECKAEGP